MAAAPLRCTVHLALGVVCLLLTPASRAASLVDVGLISSDVLTIDTNAGLTGIYVGYRVTNNDLVSYADIWVTLDNFTGGVVAPAPSAPTEYRIGPLEPGESRPVYFYLTAGGGASGQAHDVRVHDGSPANPPLSVQTFSFLVIETVASQANKIAGITITGTPEVGSSFVMEVTGQTGRLGTPGIIMLTPAGLPDWPADVFELVGVTTDIHSDCAVWYSTVEDSLVIEGPSGLDLCLSVAYEFRPTTAKPDPTPVSPVHFITSGLQIKHTPLDNLCVYTCEIPPVESPTSTLNLPISGLRLEQNVPNPFNPTTTIRFSTDHGTHLSLMIYDPSGRPVRSLFAGRLEAGTHAIEWSGLDENGHRVASGVYFYRLWDGHRVLSRKLLLLE